MKADRNCLTNESGSVLVIVIVVLVAVTALSLTMINFTTQETKMAGHYKFEKVAFYNGDSGINGTAKFIRLVYKDGEGVDEEDPQRAGCVRYLNTTSSDRGTEIVNRIGEWGEDVTKSYNDNGTGEQDPAAADISMRGCQIPADINIIRLGPLRSALTGSGVEFGAAADGLGSGGTDQPIGFRLVSTGSDDQNTTHTIRAIYLWKNVAGGL